MSFVACIFLVDRYLLKCKLPRLESGGAMLRDSSLLLGKQLGDQCVMRLIGKWLKAGVMEKEGWKATERIDALRI
jgi:hypothetical protein